MDLTIVTINKNRISCKIEAEEPIMNVKKALSLEYHWPMDEIKIHFKGNQLCDEKKSLDSYGLKDRSELYLMLNLKGGSDIFVRLLSSKTLTIEINENDTILDVKNKIREKTDDLPNNFTLIYCKTMPSTEKKIVTLEDNKRFREYLIPNEARIEVKYPENCCCSRSFCKLI